MTWGEGRDIKLHQESSVQHLQYCWRCTNPSVIFARHLFITCEWDLKIHEVPCLRHAISTYKVGAFHHAESHPSYFTLSCKVLQCTLWRCQQQHIICEKQKCYSEFPKQKCSLSWPCLEILSMKIKDRIGTPCSYSIAVRCPRDLCKGASLLQIYKTYIDWIVKLLWFHQRSYKGEDLVNCSMARKESLLLLLNQRFNSLPGSLFQHLK